MKQTGEKALRYINSIRNKEKKRYAKAYHVALLKGEADSFSLDTDLSFMARQAVEINLSEIERAFWND